MADPLAMDDTPRVASPPEDVEPIRTIKVEFGTAVYLTPKDQHRICDLVSEIIDRPYNQPADGVHWLSGMGAEPLFSPIDAALLGVDPAPPDLRPADGDEPTFDHSVYHLSTTARPFVSAEERDRTFARRGARAKAKTS